MAGTSAIDPKILLSLWVYATSEGVGSGREIARLCQMHAAYRWLCGGVEVHYHVLNDFRSEQGEVFDLGVTQVLARLMKHDLIDLLRVAQDGTRGETLEKLLAEARGPSGSGHARGGGSRFSARRKAAQKRAAEQRIARLEEALAELPAIAETKRKSGAKDQTPRTSTTDPEARGMKMGDGGFRPAYNVQLATTAEQARIIVGVEVTHRGSDMGESTPPVPSKKK